MLTKPKKHTALLLLCLLFCSVAVFAQKNFIAGQKVEVKWKDRWYKATILETKGTSFKIHYDGYDASWDETVTTNRIRTLNNGNSTGNNKAVAAKPSVHYGKYSCTATQYNNGSYEYKPKGSFVISRNNTYTYHGFTKPSKGTIKVDAATGIIRFYGGYLNNGEATPMEGNDNRYYLVFPTIPDNRWTCSLLESKD